MTATYDPLAPHYDAVAGDGVAEAAFVHDLIRQRRLIEPRRGRAATLLDVACGTGAIAASLARGYQGGYQVSGLDISTGMLAVARAKLPAGTPLYQADMTSFRLDARFDAVVCAYQGVNHLLSFPAWESFFRAHQVGDVVRGRVCRAINFGVFVELAPGVEGLCHRSEIPGTSDHRSEEPALPITSNESIKVKNEFELSEHMTDRRV